MEMSDFSHFSHSSKGSELAQKLLSSPKKESVAKVTEELTMEEVIEKVFPEFVKTDTKTNKKIINWRYIDKSALVIRS